MRRWHAALGGPAIGAIAVVSSAFAVDPPVGTNPQAEQPAPDTGTELALPDMDVISRRLDVARQQIQPSLGATSYTFSPEALQQVPQGENAPLNQVLLQAPGVAEDSFGQIHLRGEHANVQFRINGVELPEGLSVFGQAIESRFAQSMTLITGSLPAQYGFYTAGIVDIQTKTGTTNPGAAVTMYGGSFDWLQPSFEWGGRKGPVDWFVTGDFLQNDRGIENPTSSYNAIHDTTQQFHGLAYVSGIIDPNTRISVILGGFNGLFQIPNNPGQPTLGFTVNGINSFNSALLNETQREVTDFGILSLQKHMGSIDLQISAFTRYSWLRFSPDWTGDLLFNGIAQQASREDLASGIQTDSSWHVNANHTIRAGFLFQNESIAVGTVSQVLPVDATGAQTSNIPLAIGQATRDEGWLGGVYLQDEWRILPKVTINYGLRWDTVQEFTHESQVSPRVNMVWQATSSTTFTAGYSHYFVPPPFELVPPTGVAVFAGTSAAPAVTLDSQVRAERSNYFDVGVTQRIVPGLVVGADAYYKLAHNLIDEGQFGAPIILTAFNYAQGDIEGAQFTMSYDRGPWSIYANAAYSRAVGRNIVSAQFNFGPDELAFIENNFIHLDHDQKWSGSGGISYTFNEGTPQPTLLTADLLVQSGLRASTATVPNGVALPTYAVLNMSVVQTLRPGTQVRLDMLNVTDAVYQIRNGTGVGVGAPQFGLRRAVLMGLTQRF